MKPLRSTFGHLALGAALLSGGAGCVEAVVYEKAASQLEATKSALQQKDQQIRGLEWQIVTMAQQVRDAQLRGDAGQKDLAAQVQQLTVANAALGERLKMKDEESARPPLPFPGDDKSAPPDRRRAEDLRRLVAALDAHNARLIERLNRLEQKIDARAVVDDRNRPRPARPERTVDNEIIDPWGFGTRDRKSVV